MSYVILSGGEVLCSLIEIVQRSKWCCGSICHRLCELVVNPLSKKQNSCCKVIICYSFV